MRGEQPSSGTGHSLQVREIGGGAPLIVKNSGSPPQRPVFQQLTGKLTASALLA